MALSPPVRACTGSTSTSRCREFRDVLAPGAVMAIVDTERVHGTYEADLLAVIRAHSEVQHHVGMPELVEDLRATGRFVVDGELRTEPMPVEQSIDDYIELLHSTSTLARVRLGDEAPRFEAEIRDVFARHELDRVQFGVVGLVSWGRPL